MEVIDLKAHVPNYDCILEVNAVLWCFANVVICKKAFHHINRTANQGHRKPNAPSFIRLISPEHSGRVYTQ